MTTLHRILVVGGSIAAVTAVDSLRSMGYGGELTVLSAESTSPYARPPLSKAVLRGDADEVSCRLQIDPASADYRMGATAVGLDRGDRSVILTTGEHVPYDGLVIATGSRARLLGTPRQQERVVRTAADAVQLREILATARSLVLVGAGFLAFEIATAAVRAGVGVTIVSRAEPLRAVAGPHLAAMVVAAAVEAGVTVRASPGGVRLLGEPRIHGVELDDGTVIEADAVVTAAGCLPNIEWLASSLDISQGLVTDEHMRVAPNIVAAGDVAARRIFGVEPAQRTPLWMTAIAQARTASASLLGLDPIAIPEQYAWSEVFGIDIKIAGVVPPGVEPELVDGSLAERRALLRWAGDTSGAAATVDYRLPVARLRGMARQAHLTPSAV